MIRRFLLVAFACAGAASPANAHWQFTRWGMTPAQVIEVSSGTVGPGDGTKAARGNDTNDAVGTYVSGETNFITKFWFGSAGLSTVVLELRSHEQCLNVQRDLLAKYGEPIEKTGSADIQRRMWVDKLGDNRVALFNTSIGFCQIIYSPVVSKTGAGL